MLPFHMSSCLNTTTADKYAHARFLQMGKTASFLSFLIPCTFLQGDIKNIETGETNELVKTLLQAGHTHLRPLFSSLKWDHIPDRDLLTRLL